MALFLDATLFLARQSNTKPRQPARKQTLSLIVSKFDLGVSISGHIMPLCQEITLDTFDSWTSRDGEGKVAASSENI